MQTVILFDQMDGELIFFVTEQAVDSSLDGVYINDVMNEDEVNDLAIELIYDDKLEYALERITKQNAVELITDNAPLIIMGFIP